MSIECPPKIFKQFMDGCGDYVTPDKNGQQFIYEALGAGLEFLDMIELHIPELDDVSFNDWDKFVSWCENIKLGFMWEIIDEEVFYDIYESSTPATFFKTKIAVIDKIIFTATHKKSEIFRSLMYVEIKSNNEVLFLIYGEDSDGWVLGHYDSVLVVTSLDDLTPQNGFYKIK